jgi:cytochrome c nitrite reductase small subunit
MNKLMIALALAAFVLALGAGLYVTNFTAYLGDDPASCNNCHVMQTVYEGWYHGAHRAWTGCTDCHTPHAFIPKYLFKAYSGTKHVTFFTLGMIPEPLRALSYTDDVIQDNCIRCHEMAVSNVADGASDSGRYCFDCHRNVAHGQRGIPLIPYQDTVLYPSVSKE